MTPEVARFTHIMSGVTFEIAVHGEPPYYRFVINASYEGVHLYHHYHLYQFVWFPTGPGSLEKTAKAAFIKDVAPGAYQMAVKTAEGIKAQSVRRELYL